MVCNIISFLENYFYIYVILNRVVSRPKVRCQEMFTEDSILIVINVLKIIRSYLKRVAVCVTMLTDCQNSSLCDNAHRLVRVDSSFKQLKSLWKRKIQSDIFVFIVRDKNSHT